MKDIEKILAPFSLSIGKKQDLGTLLIHLRNEGVSINEVIDYIEGSKKSLQEKQTNQVTDMGNRNRIALKCSECQTVMGLFPINTCAGDQVDGSLNSVWICPNKDCMETIYNKQPVREIIKERS